MIEDENQAISGQLETWSYFTWVAKVPSVNNLDLLFNMLGSDGWELVTSVTTVKTWINLTGNDLVFIFKKRGANHKISSNIESLVNKYRGVFDEDAEQKRFMPKYDGPY